MAASYLKAAKKESHPDIVALEVTIAVDPSIKSVLDKKKRGKSFMIFTLSDGNGVVQSKLKNDYIIGEVKLETKLQM